MSGARRQASNKREEASTRPAQRVYDRLLSLADFRGHMRQEMNDVFRDAHRDAGAAGRRAVFRLWFVTAFDLARTTVAQRRSVGRQQGSPTRLLESVISDVYLLIAGARPLPLWL